MKPIAPQFTSKGWEFHQIARSDRAALYHRCRPDGSQTHYEVVILVRHNGHTWPDGTVTPPGECYPSAASWGQSGWTFSLASHREPLKSAQAKFNEVCQKADS